MPKRISKKGSSSEKAAKRPKDVNQLAQYLVSLSTVDEVTSGEIVDVPPEVSRVMAAMGSKGGKIGGKRRLETMTKKQRTDVARSAARKRWGNNKKDSK